MRGKGLFAFPVALCTALTAVAGEEPLYAKNLSPVAGLTGLPSQRSALSGPRGQMDFAVHTSLASHYVAERSDTEALNLDGETLRFAIEARYAVADDWDVQLELPWLEHSGGHLDSLIDNWHDLWGMSDGGRPDARDNLLYYRYVGRRGAFSLRDDASGIGDLSLSLTHQFYRDGDAAAAGVIGYKFASGNEDEFLGSGGEDAWLALRFSGDHLAALPLRWHGQLGYLRAGSNELLGDLQQRDLWFAGLALDWTLAPAWSLLAQVDAHRAPAESDITGIGDDAVFLTVGARWRFSRRWALDLSLVEDARVETAPDVTFQTSLRYRSDS